MHLFSRNKALIAASMAAMGVLAACGDDVVVPGQQASSVVILLSPSTASVNVNETITLSAQITGGSTTTPPTLSTCESSNTAVLTTTKVGSACQVTGVAAGNASVIVKASTGQEASAVITVNPQSAAISNMSVSPTSANLARGQTLTIVPNVTKGNPANTVTYNYVSSTPGVASVNATTGVVTAVAPGTTTITVTATGSGTGFTNATLTQGVTINVVEAPPSVTTVTVTPQNMALALGTQGQITTNVSTAAGAPASTISYISSNPAVASVSGAGLVSALAPGNATISVRVQNAGTGTLAAFDQTFSVPVSVAAQATVSLASLVQGPTITSYVDSMGSENCDSDESAQAACDDVRYAGLIYMNNPNVGQIVDANSVRDQVRLNVNLTTNGQRVDSIVIHIGDVNGQNRRQAATQTFAGGQASNGIVFFDIRTDEFTVNTTTGAVDVKHKNGLHTFNATIYSTDANGVVTTTQQALGSSTQYNFNNLDSWASVYVHPSRQAQGTNNPNLNWHGGPGAEGEGRWSIYPVFYTAGRTVQTVTTGMGVAEAAMNGAAILPICSGAVTFSPGTGLMQVTYGVTAATATRVNCSGFEHPATDARNLPYVVSTIDNSNNSAPSVTIVGGYRFMPQIVPQPVAIRLDYAGPSVVAPTVIGAEGFNWVNAAWSFTPAGIKVTDGGVGPLEATWRAFASANGGGSTFPTQIATGADLAETNTNCITTVGCDGYVARATATDALGNSANSSPTSAFGDDKTATLLRYSSAATAPASSSPMANIYNQQGTSSTLDSVAGAPNNTYLAVNGLYGVNVATAGMRELYLGTAATTGNAADSMRIEALDNRSGLSRAVVTQRRFAQGGATGTSVNTGCQTTAGVFGASFGDGWRPGPQVHVTCNSTTPGYYTTTMWAVDRAGNVSGSIAAPPSFTGGTNPAVPGSNNANLYYRRTLALDPGQPLITGVSPNNNYAGNSAQTWSLGSQDDLEVIDARLRIQYPNVTDGSGGAAPLASPGLVWSYALSNTMMPAGQGFSAGPASGTGANFGFFTPIATRFDASIINPQVSTLTQDRFTLNVQETCVGAGSPVVAPTACGGAGDPIPTASVALAKPSNLAVQVRDVFGSWIFNTTPSATTGVSSEFVSPILPATVAAPGGFSVGYSVTAPGCPQFGGAPGGPCVTSGINFRADGAPAAAVRNFRMVQDMNVTLPIFNRIELYGLNAANEWVFIQRCEVPANINPAGGSQACGGGTITGTDNGLERYWVVSFTSIPTTGFTQYRALGVNNSGFGLFSTRQP